MSFSYRATYHSLEIGRHKILRHLADCVCYFNCFLSASGERHSDDYPRFLIQRYFRVSMFIPR
jgi:hypothetical protein